MRKSKVWMVLVLALLAGTAQAAEFAVGFSHVPLARGERVMGLQLDTHAAYFSAIRRMPPGWRLAIDNDGTWNSQVKGTAIVGAAALDPAALDGMFRVVTTKELGPARLSGELLVVNDRAQERHVRLAPDDIRLTVLSK